ncbi:hypothetical protein Glove_66g21 [Diversispora epigaea]|uniref:Uncharacterized protein n=1 Tax=Diversispora epigaea TaxID=1348612 RepID=A0A397JCU9_9GLOM|nr:hypothetical protein Glove_66g21 [Diversispora epigaea]
MQQQLEDQRTKIEKFKKQLQKAYEDIAAIHNLYDKRCKKNKIFIGQQNSQFINQQEHIEVINKIANTKCELLFNDIELLIKDNKRFSIEFYDIRLYKKKMTLYMVKNILH